MSDPSNDKTSPDALAEEQRSWIQLLRNKLGMTGPQTLRDTLEGVLKVPATNAAFSDAERGMLTRLLRFGASRVDDIMVPRADITALDETQPLSELLKTFHEAGVSRIPLFRETLDDPRGMMHIKDLFRWLMAEGGLKTDKGGNGSEAGNGADSATEPGGKALINLDLSRLDLSRPIAATKIIRRQILFVPPSMPAADLLIKMQSSRNHMALVVDEYGGTDGLVTIEDLVEQIVGDIEDEHDEDEERNIASDPKHGLVASARTPVTELEEHLKMKLLGEEDEQEIDTLGGLVFSLLGRVPARGELIRHVSGVEFEVLDADPRRVKKLKIHLPRAASQTVRGASLEPGSSG